MKKLLSLFVVLVLICSCVTVLAEEELKPSEILMKSADVEKYSNFSLDLALNANVNVEVEGMGSIVVPVSVGGHMDRAGEYAHGNGFLKADILGQATDETAEFYLVTTDTESKLYTFTNGEWYVEENSISMEVGDFENMDAEAVASFDLAATASKVDGGYEIKIPLTYFVKDLGLENTVSEMTSSSEEAYVKDIADAVMKACEDAFILLNFDEEYRITGVYLNDFAVAVETTVEGAKTKGDLLLNLDVDVSSFGVVDASSVAIPDDIAEDAKASSMLASGLSAISGEMGIDDVSSDSMYEYEDEDETMIDADTEVDTESEDEGETDVESDETAVSNSGVLDLASLPADALGCVNADNISAGTNPWYILDGDGWRFDETFNGKYPFLILLNDKYSDLINMNIYGWSSTLRTEDVLNDGWSGYDISFWRVTDNLPNMTWAGLSWDNTKEDFALVYGTPANESVTADTTVYEYVINAEKGWSISFTFDNELNKLCGVFMYCC